MELKGEAREQAKRDLDVLLSVLPISIRERIEALGNEIDLLEVVMDLGRRPTARYTTGEVTLREEEVTAAEIDAVVNSIGEFDDDNRAGMARTLHRISAIRNRRGRSSGSRLALAARCTARSTSWPIC